MDEFMYEVYEWLNEPQNRCVEDLHYGWAEVYTQVELETAIFEFLAQRYSQMYGETADAKFIGECTDIYIRNLYE